MPGAPTSSEADPFDLWLRRRLKAEHDATLDEDLPRDLLRLVCDSRAEQAEMRERWLAAAEDPLDARSIHHTLERRSAETSR